VTIANGSGSITVIGVASVTPAIAGTTGNNTITGTTGNDIIDAKGGTDSVQGNGGDDTYVYHKGYGNLVVNNSSSSNNNSLGTLSFDSSVAAGNVTIARGGSNFGDLILTDAWSGDQVTVSGAFAASTNGLRQVLFANGTSWDMSYLASHAGYNVNVDGSTNTINASNAAFVNVTASNASLTVTGNSDPVTVTGSGDQINVTGNSEAITITGTGDTLAISGTSETITSSNAATITVNGTASSATINGNGNAISVAGASDAVTLAGSNDVVTIGGSNSSITASGTNETYLASRGSGQVTINNATSQGAGAQGQLDFSPDISNQNLWFVQNGNDLKIDVMGSHDQFTISNWFGSNPAASLAEIQAGNGLRLDSSVLQLVQAMATYSATNPGFDPATVTQAPTDSSLQTAIAGAWH
jgi:hypothetical protein